MQEFFAGVLFTLLVWFIWRRLVTAYRARQAETSFPTAGPGDGDGNRAGAATRNALYEIAGSLEHYYSRSAQPSDMLDHQNFRRGVEQLRRDFVPTEELLGYYTGDNAIIACLALEAIAQNPPEAAARDQLIEGLNNVAPWTQHFALKALQHSVPAGESLVGPLLLRLANHWHELISFQFLRDCIAARIAGGEQPTFGDPPPIRSAEHAEFIGSMLQRLGAELAGDLQEELERWRRTRIDYAFLRSVGEIWGDDGDATIETLIDHETLRSRVATLESSLLREHPRSVLLVGDSGVGKTAIVRALGRKLHDEGWMVFQAGHTELAAGQVYFGQLEERLQTLVRELGGKRRILWFIPDFHALLWTGRHEHKRTGAIDFLLPHIEAGNIVVVGEVQSAAYERLAQLSPRCLTALDLLRVEPLSDRATLDLARRWVGLHSDGDDHRLLSDATLEEAWNLAQQYLGERAAPGNLLSFLEQTRLRLVLGHQPDGRFELTIDDLVVTLTQLTGLPASILDERQGLDLQQLRQLFERQVMGQPEAVDCLVERVAMIKAGVTDPTRPQGVFLFAGPTGTGKTEIAKTLAEFLFGTSQRMLRLDMSELQTPEALGRVLGEPGMPIESGSDALVDQIRKQPFAVILLDEFEKAHPQIWDLFLQVFDDGRLTDRRGNTADFRHAIVILTSNLGGVVPAGARLGFGQEDRVFNPQEVERAITQVFRREFRNRLDRIVVFRPLSRETMRDILDRELAEVFHRRGLRNRAWAVEWDDGAIEFLLEKGVTIDLGARPLKRAVERYLLSPLALTIVNHQFPAGDQFLFVKRIDDRLEVEFVDPDAPDSGPDDGPVVASPEIDGAPTIESIVLHPRGNPAEVARLRAGFDGLRTMLREEAWQQHKQLALSMTQHPDFWQSAERFAILGEAEYLDRIERSIRSAEGLLDRLEGGASRDRDHYPVSLVGRLAQQIYLLQHACQGVRDKRPRYAFLQVEAGRDNITAADKHDTFARRIGGMYESWARKRGMQLRVVERVGGRERMPYRLLLAVTGFAAYPLLSAEDGLHVFEEPEAERSAFRRYRARVRVVPQPDEPAGRGHDTLLEQATAALTQGSVRQSGSWPGGGGTGSAPPVVRRYRERPSPLVRDGVRHWRTGRLEHVLDGNFDLITERETEN